MMKMNTIDRIHSLYDRLELILCTADNFYLFHP